MGKSVTIQWKGQPLTYELVDNWEAYLSSGDNPCNQNMTETTIKGIIGTISLLKALGHVGGVNGAEITSLYRAGNPNSQHAKGTAVDIADGITGPNGWYTEVVDEIALYSDNFNYGIQNAGIGAWYTGVDHEGTGWHIHFDNYLGGLCGETEEEKARMRKECLRSGGSPGKKAPGGGGATNKSLGPANNQITDHGGWVEINPQHKTYSEPVYPDYVYVQGNIPNTAVENTVVNGMENLPKANDYGLVTSQGMQDLMGMDGNAFTTDQAQKIAQRQFDPQSSISEVKVPSAGKPLNNNDPYPVDLKIEELENHQPRVKQYKLPYNKEHMETKELAEAILKLSDFTEKRLVKLENVLSTVMRYTFAIGKRMHVNCIYWGGTDHRSKYTCIRCLKDNLLEDGQVMQIDQCLSCSRYEPIIGQTYDILSEVGANLANIQDDIASGMMNMEDYINWLRIEQMHDRKLDYQLNYKTTKKRNENERPFKDQWDDGVKMGWRLVPVEEQKPQINWRQDINSADKSPEKLASYQMGNGPGSSGLTPTVSLTPGDYKSTVSGHKQFMDDVLAGKFDPKENENSGDNSSSSDSSSDSSSSGTKVNSELLVWWPKTKEAIREGFAIGKQRAEQAVKNLKLNGFEQTLQRACSEVKIDPVMGMAVIAILSQGDPAKGIFALSSGKIEDQAAEGAKKFKELVDARNKNGNPIGPVTAWKGWSDELTTLLSSPMKLFSSSSSSSSSSSAANTPSQQSFSGDLNTRMFDWEWRKALDSANIDPTFFPAVIQAYEIINAANTGLSQLKNQDTNIEFPIDTLGLNDVYWIQDFGVVSAGGGVGVASNAIIFKTKEGLKVHAPEKCDCVNGKDNSLGNFVTLATSAGKKYIFGGLAEGSASASELSAGGVCGTTTDKLIVQVKQNDQFIDPKTVWRLLNGLSVSGDKSLGVQVETQNNKGVNPK